MLQVLSFNCQKSYNKNFGKFIERIISERKYDFILLQEVNYVVYNILQPLVNLNSYQILRVRNENSDEVMQICMLYKIEFGLLKKDFISFSDYIIHEVTETGSFAGIFQVPENKKKELGTSKLLIIVTHLHSSYRIIARKKEIKALKAHVKKLDPNNECLTVIGGDFNNLLPGEWSAHDKLMLPEFVNATLFEDYTCDTRYIENHFLPKALFKFVSYTGLRWRTKIDHMYIDQKTMKNYDIESGIVDVIASDHKPIELKLTRREDNSN